MDKNRENQSGSGEYPTSKDQQGVDKAPGEEKSKGEQVSNDDLKGKKNDRDPGDISEQPIRQLP